MADAVVNPPLPPNADYSASTAASPQASGDSAVSMPSGSPPVNTADNSVGLGANSGFSLADILNKVAGTNAASQSAIAGITDSFNSLKSAGAAMVNAVMQKSQDDTAVAQVKGLGELRAQQNARSVAAALGTNMDDAGQQLTGLASTMLDSYQKAQSSAADLQELNSRNFLDDPISWLSGELFERKPVTAAYTGAATTYNNAEQQLSSILSLTQADTKVQNDIAQTKNAASVQAASDSIAQEGVVNAQKVAQQNLLYNVQGIQAVQQLNESQLNNSVQALSAINQGQELELRQQQAAKANQNADLQRQEMQQRIDMNQVSIDDMNTTAALINKGRASIGLDPIPPAKAMALFKLKGPAGQAINDQYTMGATSDSIGKVIVSDNAGDAARILVTSRAPLTPSQAPIKSLLTDTYGGVQGGQLVKNIDLKNPAAVSASTAAFVTSRAQSMAATINPADGTNIYTPPDLQSVASLPGVQSTPLFQKVLAPVLAAAQTQGQVTKFDPDVISGLALAAVQNKTISFNEATQGIQTLANGAVMTNNVTKDYTKFGIRPQSSLNMKVDDPISGRSSVVNFNDPTQVANYLSKQQIGTSVYGQSLFQLGK